MAPDRRTLLLTRSEIRQLMPFSAYLPVIEEAFRLYATGRALHPGLLHIDSIDGEFHIKAGGLELNRRYFALKSNGGFFGNAERHGLPNIQGLIVLADGSTGSPLAVMDSGEITMKRTGAAAAVAARYLARPESSRVTICGCGVQGQVQLEAMQAAFPLQAAFAYDVDHTKAQAFAREMSSRLGTEVQAVHDLPAALRQTDICVTCTPSRKFYVAKNDIAPGTFVAAMGADSPEKQELDPELLKSSKVVVDLLEQCAQVGELHHAIDAGMSAKAVHAELGEIIAGRKPGRTSEQEIIVFDATGTALQDVAAAAAVYEEAVRLRVGTYIDFFR
ncbi:MAG: ornithine cyclodeaminase family protein [Candidatus Korobacteraceae bacterium]